MSTWQKVLVLSVVSVFGLLGIYGCKYTDPNWLNPTIFNNKLVEGVNNVKEKIEKAQDIYDQAIPKEVSEKTEIDASEMAAAYEELKLASTEVKKLSDLKSRNEDQQKKVITEFEKYLKTVLDYEMTYKELLLFYDTGEYKKLLNQVEEFDKKLTANYESYGQKNNELVELLGQFK